LADTAEPRGNSNAHQKIPTTGAFHFGNQALASADPRIGKKRAKKNVAGNKTVATHLKQGAWTIGKTV